MLWSKAMTAFRGLPAVAVPTAAPEHSGRVKAAAESAGVTFEDNDLWIAATPLAIDAIIITRDPDFYRPPKLRVEDWT